MREFGMELVLQLSKQEKNIKKIHDLGAILEECIKIDGDFENLKLECVTLTDYYVPTRYPDIAQFVDFTEVKAKEAYLLAKKIIEFIEQKLDGQDCTLTSVSSSSKIML